MAAMVLQFISSSMWIKPVLLPTLVNPDKMLSVAISTVDTTELLNPHPPVVDVHLGAVRALDCKILIP